MLESWRHLNPRRRLRAQVRGDRTASRWWRSAASTPAPTGSTSRTAAAAPAPPSAVDQKHAGVPVRGGAADRARHAGRGGRARPGRAQRRRRRADRRAGAQADAARRRPDRLRHERCSSRSAARCCASATWPVRSPAIRPARAASAAASASPRRTRRSSRASPAAPATSPTTCSRSRARCAPDWRASASAAPPTSIGRRDLLERRDDLTGKAALLDVAPPGQRAAARASGAAPRAPEPAPRAAAAGARGRGRRSGRSTAARSRSPAA